jgi:hypothetical protein
MPQCKAITFGHVAHNACMLLLPQMNSDLFGGGDAVVKYVLEGHDRGVNWAVRML